MNDELRELASEWRELKRELEGLAARFPKRREVDFPLTVEGVPVAVDELDLDRAVRDWRDRLFRTLEETEFLLKHGSLKHFENLRLVIAWKDVARQPFYSRAVCLREMERAAKLVDEQASKGMEVQQRQEAAPEASATAEDSGLVSLPEGWPQKLKAVREKRDQTQKEAAHEFKVSLGTYRKWETGKRPKPLGRSARKIHERILKSKH